MINADYFLKDGVSVEEFTKALKEYSYDYGMLTSIDEDVPKFLKSSYKPIKPTLTEDERVILSNLSKDYIFIGKKDKFLYIKADKENEDYFAGNIRGLDIIFPNLFQFIKERRRIQDR